MAHLMDLVMLKDGQSLGGVVQEKTFAVKTRFGTVKLPKQDVRAVYYKSPSAIPATELHAGEGTKFAGDVEPKVIRFKVEKSGVVLRLPRADLAALVMFQGTKGKISAKTAQALAKAKEKDRKKPDPA